MHSASAENRAREILALLDYVSPHSELVRRATTFIEVNGYGQVEAAARYTEERMKRQAVDRPWNYTCETINRNTGRLVYAFQLIHWAEIALRASLDQSQALEHGSSWFLSEVYWEPTRIRGLPNDPEQRRIRWRYDVSSGRMVPDYLTADGYLGDMTINLLRDLALYAEGRPDESALIRVSRPIMVDVSGNRLPFSTIEEHLKLLVKVRNEVAHNRPLVFDSGGRLRIGRHPYDSSIQRIEQILAALRFDVAKALNRILPKQCDALFDGIVRNGGQDPRRRQA